MVTAVEEQFLMVRLARDRGWDSSLISQHYLSDGNIQQLQQVPLLARMIGESGEMTTGVAIFLLNLHNPVYVAETMASLDILAKGNFVFGIGIALDLAGDGSSRGRQRPTVAFRARALLRPGKSVSGQ
jgi:alkanesulfonate monooxygenase SsuD/methylene tetrahydromethanopterin reductase-like flavin-dependent oxidoreductase (luciferase family)